MKDQNTEVLLRRVGDAFSTLPMSTTENLVDNTSGDQLERDEVRKRFVGRHWEELSIDDLLEDPQALFFLSVEGYRFFLPALVRATLLDYDRADLLPMVVVDSLRQPDDPYLIPYHQARVESLSSQQRAVLREFMLYLRARHGDEFPFGELESAEKVLAE